MSENIIEKPDLIVTRYCGPNRTRMYQLNGYSPIGREWHYIVISEKDAIDMAIVILQAYIDRDYKD